MSDNNAMPQTPFDNNPTSSPSQSFTEPQSSSASQTSQASQASQSPVLQPQNASQPPLDPSASATPHYDAAAYAQQPTASDQSSSNPFPYAQQPSQSPYTSPQYYTQTPYQAGDSAQSGQFGQPAQSAQYSQTGTQPPMPGQPYPQGPYYPYGAYPMPANERWNVMCIVGFVLSFVFAPVGLVLSIVALIQINKSGEKSKGMSIAGIIIGAVNTLMLLVAIVALVAFMGAAAGYMERNGAYFGDDSTPADCAFEVNGQCYGFDDLDDYAEDYYRLNGELPGDLSGWLDAADGNVDYSTVIDVR